MYLWMLSPGPSMALIARNSVKYGIKTTKFTIFGIVTSIAVYSILAVLGIGAITNAYPAGFKIFKTIGSAYICFVGLKLLLNSFKNDGLKFEDTNGSKIPSKISLFLHGFTTDLSNPMTVVGITSIILGFVNVSDPLSSKITLLSITIIDAFLYAYTFSFLFGNKISRQFILPRINLFERVAGSIIILIGVGFLINIFR